MTLPPGSTFKLVTAAAAIESGNWTPPRWCRPGRPTSCRRPPARPASSTTRAARSATPSGSRSRRRWSGRATPPSPSSPSRSAPRRCTTRRRRSGSTSTTSTTSARRPSRSSPPASTSRRPARPASASSTCAATPLQMAMVAAGIANGGTVMKPYIVDEVQSADLDILDKTEPTELSQAVSPTTANELTKMMVATVNEGTADDAADPGRRGGRQDRHRAERRRGQAAVRLVRLVRPRRRPPGRGGGDDRERARQGHKRDRWRGLGRVRSPKP